MLVPVEHVADADDPCAHLIVATDLTTAGESAVAARRGEAGRDVGHFDIRPGSADVAADIATRPRKGGWRRRSTQGPSSAGQPLKPGRRPDRLSLRQAASRNVFALLPSNSYARQAIETRPVRFNRHCLCNLLSSLKNRKICIWEWRKWHTRRRQTCGSRSGATASLTNGKRISPSDTRQNKTDPHAHSKIASTLIAEYARPCRASAASCMTCVRTGEPKRLRRVAIFLYLSWR